MSVSVAAAELPESAADEYSIVGEHPVEWWYANLIIDAPGTPVDGMTLLTIFSIFKGVIEEVRRIIVSPDGGVFVDFGSGELESGSITADRTKLDVRQGPDNWFRGSYPDYHVHLEGEATSGTYVTADLSYVADAAPHRESYMDGQMTHWVDYRVHGTGTISLGAKSYDVKGVGYIEHLFGTLGWFEPFLGETRLPHFAEGWNWYWTPAAGPDRVIIQAGNFLVEGEPVPWAFVSVDGKTFHSFDNADVEVLEQREYAGTPYAHRIRLTKSTDAGKVDLTFTRRDAAQRMTKGAGTSSLIFVSGFVELAGTVEIDGVSYDVTTDQCFGSTFRGDFSAVLHGFRKLPNPVRVPIGRVVNALRQLKGS